MFGTTDNSEYSQTYHYTKLRVYMVNRYAHSLASPKTLEAVWDSDSDTTSLNSFVNSPDFNTDSTYMIIGETNYDNTAAASLFIFTPQFTD